MARCRVAVRTLLSLFLHVTLIGNAIRVEGAYGTRKVDKPNENESTKFSTNSIGVTKMVDLNTRTVAYKDFVRKTCYIEKITSQSVWENGRMLLIHPKPLTNDELLTIAGPTIANFCFAWQSRILRLQSNSEIRRRRSNPHYFVARKTRGQTQSQYLNFGNGNNEPGKAEAESTNSGSKALVYGSNGMGQAQSQSGPFSCADCFGPGGSQLQAMKPGQTSPLYVQSSGDQSRIGGIGQDGRRDQLGGPGFLQIPGAHGTPGTPGTPGAPGGTPPASLQRPGVTQYQPGTSGTLPGHGPGGIGDLGVRPPTGTGSHVYGPDGRIISTTPGQVTVPGSYQPGQQVYTGTPGGVTGVGPGPGQTITSPGTGQQPGYVDRGGVGAPGQQVYGPGGATLPGQQIYGPGGVSTPGQQQIYGPGGVSTPGQQTYGPGGVGAPGQQIYGPGGVSLPGQQIYGPGGAGVPGQQTYDQSGRLIPSGQQTYDQGRIQTPGGQQIYQPGGPQPSDGKQVYDHSGRPIGGGQTYQPGTQRPGAPGQISYDQSGKPITTPGQQIYETQKPGQLIYDQSGRPITSGQQTYDQGRVQIPGTSQIYQPGGQQSGRPITGTLGQQIFDQDGIRRPGGRPPHPGDVQTLTPGTVPGTAPGQTTYFIPGGSRISPGQQQASDGTFTGKVTGQYQTPVGQSGEFSGSFHGNYNVQGGPPQGTVTGITSSTSGSLPGAQQGVDTGRGQPGFIYAPGVPGQPGGYQPGVPSTTGQITSGSQLYGPGAGQGVSPGTPDVQAPTGPQQYGQVHIPGTAGTGPGYMPGGITSPGITQPGQVYIPGTPGYPGTAGTGSIPGTSQIGQTQIPGRPGVQPVQTYIPGTPGFPGQQPGVGTGVTYQPGIGGYQPGQTQQPGGGPGGQITQPGAGTGVIYQPGQVQQPGVGQVGQISQPGVGTTGIQYQPGTGVGQTQQPGSTYQPGTGIYQPGQIQQPGVGQVGQITQPGVGTGVGYQPGTITGGVYQPGQVQQPSGGQITQPGVGTGTIYQPGAGPQYTGGQIGTQQPGTTIGTSYQPGTTTYGQSPYPGGPGGQQITTGGQSGAPGSQIYGPGVGQLPGGAPGTVLYGPDGKVITTHDAYGQAPGALYAGPGGISGQGQAVADDSDSQAQSTIQRVNNETQASASSSGRYQGGTAQSQVSGSYSGQGSFSASAGTNDGLRGAQTQVTGNKDGAVSSSQGQGGKGQSQAQVQTSADTGDTKSSAQSSGINHGTNTQVQSGIKGGMADAQANGPGSTSSQAQIGFTPYDVSEQEENFDNPHVGGGTASASSGTHAGKSQVQINGKYAFGIRYTGQAQASSANSGYTAGDFNLPTMKPLEFGQSNQNYDKIVKQEKTTNVRQIEEAKILKLVPLSTPPPAPVDDAQYDYDEDYEEEEPPPVQQQQQLPPQQRPTRNLTFNSIDPLDEIELPKVQLKLKHGDVLQQGEQVPGTNGYKIPAGFRGRVTENHNFDNSASGTRPIVYAAGAKANRHSSFDDVGFGSGFSYQPTYSPVQYGFKSTKTFPPKFVSVTKSETGSRNVLTGKKTPSVYYTQSSTCGYFTNSCFYSNGKKICMPKLKSNHPDGSPILCVN